VLLVLFLLLLSRRRGERGEGGFTMEGESFGGFRVGLMFGFQMRGSLTLKLISMADQI